MAQAFAYKADCLVPASIQTVVRRANVGMRYVAAACGDPVKFGNGTVVVMCVALAGCTTAADGASGGSRSPAIDTVLPASATEEVFVRPCDSSHQQLDEAPSGPVGVGPIVFEAFDGSSLPSSQLVPQSDGTLYPHKFPIVVDSTAGSVEVRVDDGSRNALGLNYDRADWAQDLDSAQSAVVFDCDAIQTFNGGFLVASPGCHGIDVSWDDQVEALVLPFGVDEC